MILRAPVAKGKPSNDNTVDVTFWMSGAVPNTLYRRITSTSHSIDRVIRTIDVNHNSANDFASSSPCAISEGDLLLKGGASEEGPFLKTSVSEGESFLKKSAPIELIVSPTIRSPTAAGIDLTFTPYKRV